jgi:hypothetical protein
MRTWMVAAVLALMALAEIRLFDRLLYDDAPEFGFVVESVDGVLSGRPVSKSWAHRLLAPAAVAALGRVSGWERRRAVQRFGEAMIAASVVALYLLLRRKGVAQRSALVALATFALVHAIIVYKLEYPWDGVDVLLFLAFGAHAARAGGIAGTWPLLVAGTLNHETIAYVPLWYLLAPLDGGPRRWRDAAAGALVLVPLLGIIAALRQWRYVGRPALPPSVFEPATPVVENHVHVVHNLRAVFLDNWYFGRTFNSVIVLAMLLVFTIALVRRDRVRAAAWSLLVMVSILCFGYLNETRHYLVLLAFWITYRWPASASETVTT